MKSNQELKETFLNILTLNSVGFPIAKIWGGGILCSNGEV